MAQVSKDSEFEKSSDFIESGKSYKRNKKKGGPYSKHERIARQDEVYRLYFEYSYSARKISELMKIPRNTINGDIDYWYGKILTNSNVIDPELAVIVDLERLNAQKSRLREGLDKCENFQQRFETEKLILDIDYKIINTRLKLSNTMKRVHNLGINYINKWFKENGKDNRYLHFFDQISVSEKAQQEIEKIIKEDKIKTGI